MKNIVSVLLLQAFIIRICLAMQEDVNFLALLSAEVFQKNIAGCLDYPDIYALKRTCSTCNNDIDFSHMSPLFLSDLPSEECTKTLIFFAQQKRENEFKHFFVHNNHGRRKNALIVLGWADDRLNDMDYCMNAYCNPVNKNSSQWSPPPGTLLFIVIEMACYSPHRVDKNVILSKLFLYDARWNDVEKRLAHWLKRPDIDFNIRDKFNNAALFHLYTQKKINLVKQLLEHPEVDVNVRDVHNHNLLISALWGCDVEMINILLQHPRIDRTVRDYQGWTIYQIAHHKGIQLDEAPLKS